MNNRGIRFRVLILALLPLILVAIGLSWYFMQARYSALEQALEDRAESMASQLGKACELALFAGNIELLERLARPMLRVNDVQAVVIADRNGQTLLALGAVPKALYRQPGGATSIRSDASVLVVHAPVKAPRLDAAEVPTVGADAGLMGYVTLAVSRTATKARQQAMLMAGLSITALGVALAALLAWRLGRDIVRPIGRLAAVVARVGAGDLNARVKLATGGEFARLEQGVNHMASELKASYETLQEKIRAATTKLAWQAMMP
jgi:HAMP domain-containing protein